MGVGETAGRLGSESIVKMAVRDRDQAEGTTLSRRELGGRHSIGLWQRGAWSKELTTYLRCSIHPRLPHVA
jgi:hypothetical protein